MEVLWTNRPGDGTAAAAAAGQRFVVAMGGDGTAHEVVNGLLGRSGMGSRRFGALQVGTGSDLVRTVASPRRPEQVPAWLASAAWRPLDVAGVQTSTGHRFVVNVADVGIGAAVAGRASRLPAQLGGRARFLSAAILSLLVHKNAAIDIRCDGMPAERVRGRTVVVANGAYFGGGMWVAPQARPDDGHLDVVIIGDLGRLEGIVRMPLLYQGRHGRLRKVRFLRVRRIEIDSPEPQEIEADGELVGETPAEFEVIPAALQVPAWPP